MPEQHTKRRDRPGYHERRRADGSAARYWHPRRAFKKAPNTMPGRRIPDHLSDSEVSILCRDWTADLKKELADEAKHRATFERRHIATHLGGIYAKRAACNGWPCSIDAEWIERKLVDLDDRCEVSGLLFDYSAPQKVRKYFKHPMRPSLDRIDNADGYVPNNVFHQRRHQRMGSRPLPHNLPRCRCQTVASTGGLKWRTTKVIGCGRGGDRDGVMMMSAFVKRVGVRK
ncbi:hypothetical protein NKJ09_22575 [Mesorhizobium sp. M0189]|uniref:hypothetical protein n=1 Tax=Mesorhizobium sp. M0189 TaxID=2956909 RepID=UPI0033394BF8